MRRWACCGTSSASCQSYRSRSRAAGPAVRAANWPWPATCASPPGRTASWDRSRSASAPPLAPVPCSTWRGCSSEAGPWRRSSSPTTSTPSRRERYGWINRALPDADLDVFVARLARRIAWFAPQAVRSAKRTLNELTLPGADAIRADARRFRQLVASDPAKPRTAALFAQGLQAPGPVELDLGDRVGAL